MNLLWRGARWQYENIGTQLFILLLIFKILPNKNERTDAATGRYSLGYQNILSIVH